MADIGTAYVKIEPTAQGISKKIESELSGVGTSGGRSFNAGFASVIGGTSRIIGATAIAATSAVGAGAAAVGSLVKQASDSYAEFEQLEGGAQLMFGDGFDKVMDNASTAFSRVQMSANQYLTEANRYATGLKQSLGGDGTAAADLADRIITAQADIVAATGAQAENVSNAFAGIMKNNFTMLDNLQIGIKPTQEGMKELIAQMNELNGTDYEFGNLADMQSALVDYIEYVGMAGYAHNEASGTIQGSLASAKAAWSDLLTGLATEGADIPQLVSNLTTSLSGFATNMMPTIQQALLGISTLITEMAPMIAEAIPSMLSTVLPQLLPVALQVVDTLAQGILQALPGLTPVVTQILTTIIEMILALAHRMLEVGMQIIIELANGLAQAAPTMIPQITQVITQLVMMLTQNAPMLVQAAIALMQGLTQGLIAAVPILIEQAPQLILALIQALAASYPMMMTAGINLIGTLVTGIISAFAKLIEVGADLVNNIKKGFDQYIESAKQWGKDLIDNLVNGIKENIGRVKDAVVNVAKTIKDNLGFSEPEEGPLSNFHTYAPDMIDLFVKGIRDNEGLIQKQLNDTFNLSPTATAPAESTAYYGGVSINIYGAEGQDVNELAEIIEEKLYDSYSNRRAAFG